MAVSPDRKLLEIDDVIEITSLKRTMLYEMVRDGSFPPPVAIGKAGRLKRWRRADVDWWVEQANRQQPLKPDKDGS